MRLAMYLFTTACGHAGFAVDGDGGSTFDGNNTVNHVFVTSAMQTGNLGGLAGADAVCANAAAASGLPGTFVAWLSTGTVNALDRLSGSRGWVRVDGVPVFDTIDAAVQQGKMFNPVSIDETGMTAIDGTMMRTGTLSDGRVIPNPAQRCGEWTTSTTTGSLLPLGSPKDGVPGFTASNVVVDCSQVASLLCFGIGGSTVVAPQPGPSGHVVFISTSLRGSGGVSQLDTICQSEASAAGLSGTFLAAVATTTSSIASRFPVDTEPVVRVDGTIVATSLSAMMSSFSDLRSFVNQHADGTYVRDLNIATGAMSPQAIGTNPGTCTNWTDASSTLAGSVAGLPSTSNAARFWGMYTTQCSVPTPVLCLRL